MAHPMALVANNLPISCTQITPWWLLCTLVVGAYSGILVGSKRGSIAVWLVSVGAIVMSSNFFPHTGQHLLLWHHQILHLSQQFPFHPRLDCATPGGDKALTDTWLTGLFIILSCCPCFFNHGSEPKTIWSLYFSRLAAATASVNDFGLASKTSLFKLGRSPCKKCSRHKLSWSSLDIVECALLVISWMTRPKPATGSSVLGHGYTSPYNTFFWPLEAKSVRKERL